MPGPVWIDAIAFDTSKSPPERTPAREPVQVRTSVLPPPTTPVRVPAKAAPPLIPLHSLHSLGPPALAELVGTASRLVAAFDMVRRERPDGWEFRPKVPAGELRAHRTAEQVRWRDVDALVAPVTGALGSPEFTPGLPGLMLAIDDALRLADRCDPESVEAACFACRVNGICAVRLAGGPIDYSAQPRIRVPIAYPVAQLEALDAWAKSRAREHKLTDGEIETLRFIASERFASFGWIKKHLDRWEKDRDPEASAHDSTVAKRLKKLVRCFYVKTVYSNYEITDLGRAVAAAGAQP